MILVSPVSVPYFVLCIEAPASNDRLQKTHCIEFTFNFSPFNPNANMSSKLF